MRLRVNGEYLETDSETVAQLLSELNIRPERVAVEVNVKIITKPDYGVCRLSEGDTVEIVNFVGGG